VKRISREERAYFAGFLGDAESADGAKGASEIFSFGFLLAAGFLTLAFLFALLLDDILRGGGGETLGHQVVAKISQLHVHQLPLISQALHACAKRAQADSVERSASMRGEAARSCTHSSAAAPASSSPPASPLWLALLPQRNAKLVLAAMPRCVSFPSLPIPTALTPSLLPFSFSGLRASVGLQNPPKL
jgi:hypothetical protein